MIKATSASDYFNNKGYCKYRDQCHNQHFYETSSGIIRTGQELSRLVSNDQDWPGMVRTGQKLSGLVKNNQDWSGMIRTDQEWSGIVRTGKKLSVWG